MQTKTKHGQMLPDAVDRSEGWVREILGSVRGSDQFAERCERTALAAFALDRLRREREKRGFFAASVREFLVSLAGWAEVSLKPVADRFGVRDLELAGSNVLGIAGLLRALGVSCEEARILIRISFAERAALWPLAPVRARDAGGAMDRTASVNLTAVLDHLELGMSPDGRMELSAALTCLEKVFRLG